MNTSVQGLLLAAAISASQSATMPALEEALKDPRVKEALNTFQLDRTCIKITNSSDARNREDGVYATKDGIFVYAGLSSSNIAGMLPWRIRDYKELISPLWGGGIASRSEALKLALKDPAVKAELKKWNIKPEEIQIFFNPKSGVPYRVTNNGIFLYGGEGSSRMIEMLMWRIGEYAGIKEKFSQLMVAVQNDKALTASLVKLKIDPQKDIIITDRQTEIFNRVTLEQEMIGPNNILKVSGPEIKLCLNRYLSVDEMLTAVRQQAPALAKLR
jgi:hypothetical protein